MELLTIRTAAFCLIISALRLLGLVLVLLLSCTGVVAVGTGAVYADAACVVDLCC